MLVLPSMSEDPRSKQSAHRVPKNFREERKCNQSVCRVPNSHWGEEKKNLSLPQRETLRLCCKNSLYLHFTRISPHWVRKSTEWLSGLITFFTKNCYSIILTLSKFTLFIFNRDYCDIPLFSMLYNLREELSTIFGSVPIAKLNGLSHQLAHKSQWKSHTKIGLCHAKKAVGHTTF